ncbi:hypothetical protein NUW54_g13793 [Trametes sanguinea]|uniref:Uncharacterized protein n=1 Tax=Trametes sanguinea TaxID=158606 RepID=A0ACC1MHK7_9APHY|nr:hypothetical protein NUW54_g13793 [Trametes sanguinea]
MHCSKGRTSAPSSCAPWSGTRSSELVTADDERKLSVNVRNALARGFFTQLANKEGETNAYLTVKDNQVVSLHPSCGLDTSPEWVIFNEFVMTTKPYIRMVSEVKPDERRRRAMLRRLLEHAPNYYDLSTFPDGETKCALLRLQRKQGRNLPGSAPSSGRNIPRGSIASGKLTRKEQRK